MKKLLLLILLLPFIADAQEIKTHMIGTDTLVVSNGMKIYKGVVLKIGRPSDDRAQFSYLTTSPGLTALNGNYSSNGFGRDYAGREFTVKKLRKQSSKKLGDKYFAIAGVHLITCWIDIENAFASGEIIVPEEYRDVKSLNDSESTGSLSVADELKKLKGLLDEGILSQEEFDQQKSKILN